MNGDENPLAKDVFNRDVTVQYWPHHYLHKVYERQSHNREISPSELWGGHRFSIKVNRKHNVVINKYIVGSLNLTKTDDVYGFVISDTEEKFIRLRLFDNTSKIINLEIVHGNAPGAIYSFAAHILETGNKQFNIIACFNRLEAKSTKCRWFAIIDISSNPKAAKNFIDKNDWKNMPKN